MWREVSEQRLLSGPGMAGSHQWAGLENMEVLLLAWLLGDLPSPGSVLTLWGLQALTVPPGTVSLISQSRTSQQQIFLNFSKQQNYFLKVNVILELNIYVARLMF